MSRAPASLPPQDLDAEEAVLGAMMLSPNAVDAVSEVVAADDFYRGSHALIFEAALAMHVAGGAVDSITVADELERRGQLAEAGGKERVHELASLIPATANAPHYARIVREMAVLRKVAEAGRRMVVMALEREGTAAEIVERAEELAFGIGRARHAGALGPIRDAVGAAYDELRALHERGADTSGLTVGLPDVDRFTSGLQPGELVVVAGRPSMGKTAFALGAAADVTMRQGRPAALFTLEMTRREVVKRLMSAEGRVDGKLLRNGRLERDDWDRLHAVSPRIHDAPLYVEAGSLVTIGDVRSKARKLRARLPDLALVIVDYLQLMTSGAPADSRVQAVSEISRGLKVLAGELELPVLALSQLSRQVEQRHDRRPMLSDLRESGSIEQDADVVLFLYREEYYFPEDDEHRGVAEVIFAKQRNGPTGTVKCSWLAPYAKFSSLLPGGAA